MNYNVKGQLVGPKAASFGVIQPLIHKIENENDVQSVNSNMCLIFFAKEGVEVSYIENLAIQIKDSILTFKVNGTDLWPSRLTNFLFNETLDNQIVLTDMSIPIGKK